MWLRGKGEGEKYILAWNLKHRVVYIQESITFQKVDHSW